MGTKCIVLGENKEERKGTPIEFESFLASDFSIELWEGMMKEPNEFNIIELICKNYDEGDHGEKDLMFAYNVIRSRGFFVIGHWNDGFVKE
jgi:hypothetical protein